MNTVKLLLCIFCATVVLQAGILVGENKTDISKLDDVYYIVVSMEEVGTRIWPEVDYGQQDRNKMMKVVDVSGDRIKFESISHVLNYFYKDGWKISQSYVTVHQPSEVIYNTEVFVLERR